MTLDFFSRLQTLGVERFLARISHDAPAPQIRVPIVQNAAQQWNRTAEKSAAIPFRF